MCPLNVLELGEDISQSQHWLRGGFPNALLAKSQKQAWLWVDSFIKSYIEIDMSRLYGVNLSSVTLQKLWKKVAQLHGCILSAEDISRSIGVSAPTVDRYLDYMDGAFLLRKLQPWYSNGAKRLVKAPKLYLRDSAILHSLLRLESIDEILGHPAAGNSWEGFVIEQICQTKPYQLDAYYYRTHDGTECDLLLVKGDRPMACIEIKLTNAPTVSKGFYISQKDLSPKYAFVITPSSEDYTVNHGTMVTSLKKFVTHHLPTLAI